MMTMRPGVRLLLAAGCLVATGCGGPSHAGGTQPTSASAPSSTAAAAASPTPTSPAPTAPAPTATGAAPTARGPQPCTTAHLSVELSPAGNGAAGHIVFPLQFINASTVACTLKGFPGVSYVAPGNGQQVGQPAIQSQTAPDATVTLAPGAGAHALFEELNYPQGFPGCRQTRTGGLRVYPPGQTSAAFIALAPSIECANNTNISISPVLAGANVGPAG